MLFPEPDSPRTPTISPEPSSKLTSDNAAARCPPQPYFTVNPLTDKNGEPTDDTVADGFHIKEIPYEERAIHCDGDK